MLGWNQKGLAGNWFRIELCLMCIDYIFHLRYYFPIIYSHGFLHKMSSRKMFLCKPLVSIPCSVKLKNKLFFQTPAQ